MPEKRFQDHLRRRGLRLTRERRAVLREIEDLNGHFEPEQLLVRLREKGIPVSRASVYRTLPLLLDCGLIEEAVYKDRKTRYEKCQGRDHHDHLICTSCGKIIEFLSEPIESLQDEICRGHGFSPVSHTLEIRGLCDSCSETGEGSTSIAKES